VLALSVIVAAAAPPPTTCGRGDDYSMALCAYQRRDFAEAEGRFRAMVEKNAQEPETVRAIYFLVVRLPAWRVPTGNRKGVTVLSPEC
jgi:TolA-binding protein